MDTRRLILLLIFSFSLVMLWEGWQKYNLPPQSASTFSTRLQTANGKSNDVPTLTTALSPTLSPKETLAFPAQAQSSKATDVKAIVKTDVMEAEISSRGGDLVNLTLIKHKATDDKKKSFVLFEKDGQHVYVAQTGLIGEGLPVHNTEFSLVPGAYTLKKDSDTVQVRLEAPETEKGVKVAKIYTFHRGSYIIQVSYEITNKGQAPLMTNAYFQFVHDGTPPHSGAQFISTYTGPAIYTEESKFQKVPFKDIAQDKANYAHNASNGWVGMVQHYFVGAWLPQGEAAREFFARKIDDNLYTAGLILPVPQVASGKTAVLSVPLYAGPQEQKKLADIAPGLGLVVDYGWLTIIAAPLFWVLSWLHSFVGNWGWAIIALTVLLKIIFFPLSAASYKSMAKMRVVTPRMMKLKELYGNDKPRLNKEMMELYRKEKINPMGGCLPMIVQIPVFIALYWVLLGTVEMRHAPFMLWITDMSAKDPYFILPLIMGVTMLIQTRLNPAPPDPIQAKIMLIMPVVFTAMFLWSPAGLVLYWTVNNLLSIAQQWQITRMLERGQPKNKKTV